MRASGEPALLGYTMITAHDVVKFYANVLTGSVSPADEDYLFGLLHRIALVPSDGFDSLFGVNGVESAPGHGHRGNPLDPERNDLRAPTPRSPF